MEDIYITSRSNPLVVSFAKLADKKERDKTGLYIAEGYKLCEQASGYGNVVYAVLREDRVRDNAYMRLAERCGGERIILSAAAYDKITNDRTPDGILFVMRAVSMEISDSLSDKRICVLDGVQDPGNVGTILRTAAAFGINRVILRDCADAYNPKVIRATMGAFFKVSISLCDDITKLIKNIQSTGRRVLAAALCDGGITLGKEALYPDDCLVLGNEGHGISDSVIRACDTTIRIPMTEKTESLNAAAAAAVLFWELSKLNEGIR